MNEILLNEETFQGLSSHFDTAFSQAKEAARFAGNAESIYCVNFTSVLINSRISSKADDIRNIMQTIVNSFTETDQANRDKALKIREEYVGTQTSIPLPDISDGLLQHSELLDKYFKRSDSHAAIKKSMKNQKVEYVPVKKYDGERTEQEIIDQLAGDDLTPGSCASVAYAYAASKGGYDVNDFRDGASRSLFSSEGVLNEIIKMPGVVSYKKSGYNEIKNANELLGKMKPGKEYILFTGQHACVVRKVGNEYQGLELQSTTESLKGWHTLSDNALKNRFGCDSGLSSWFTHLSAPTSYLVEIDSLSNSEEFINISGYFNTNSGSQVVGSGGGMK